MANEYNRYEGLTDEEIRDRLKQKKDQFIKSLGHYSDDNRNIIREVYKGIVPVTDEEIRLRLEKKKEEFINSIYEELITDEEIRLRLEKKKEEFLKKSVHYSDNNRDFVREIYKGIIPVTNEERRLRLEKKKEEFLNHIYEEFITDEEIRDRLKQKKKDFLATSAQYFDDNKDFVREMYKGIVPITDEDRIARIKQKKKDFLRTSAHYYTDNKDTVRGILNGSRLPKTLTSMRYKSFTWEYNPATCTYSCQRTYVAHKYPELAGVELEDMDVNEVVVTGKGEFFGPNAYTNWQRLNAEFRTFGSGEFYHPVFTDITRGLMTKLQADMEPREDYVAYTFEIIGDTGVNEINTPSVIPASENTDASSADIKVGDIVILTGYAYYDSYGSLPRSAYKNGIQYVVTNVNYKGSHPIHCSTLGWCDLTSIKLVQSKSVLTGITPGTNGTYHIVKAGETLAGICSKYGAYWVPVAEHNGIKNPHMIYPGQRIEIPSSLMAPKVPIGYSVGNNMPKSKSSVPILPILPSILPQGTPAKDYQDYVSI